MTRTEVLEQAMKSAVAAYGDGGNVTSAEEYQAWFSNVSTSVRKGMAEFDARVARSATRGVTAGYRRSHLGQ